MIDFELNDMIPRYCELQRTVGNMKYRLEHYMPQDCWGWRVIIETDSERPDVICNPEYYKTPGKAFESMKEFCDALQS